MAHFLGKVADKVKRFNQEHAGGGGSSAFPGQNAHAPPGPGAYAPPPSLPAHGSRPAQYPSPTSGIQGPGQLPPRVKHVEQHDRMTFYHPSGRPHDTLRDLGFSGVLSNRVVWTFGDTLMGVEGNSMICAVDSTCISHDLTRPMHVTDTKLAPGTNNVGNLINCNPHEQARGGLSCYSFGGSNIVEVAPGEGVIYYLKLHRPGGNATVHGAGVAHVRLHPGDVPVAERPHDTLWTADEPQWGDCGIQLDPRDGMVYAYGMGPACDPELNARRFLCRCPRDQTTRLASYEYWLHNEQRWVRERPTARAGGQPGMLQLKKEHAIWDWHVMGQSNPFWSHYFNCWMWIHGTGWPFSEVLCHTADRLEGPWRDHGSLADTRRPHYAEGYLYCVTGHPEFDPSGKTVLATWTQNNVIYGCTIEFE